MQVWRMRTGIVITLKPADRRRLKALARDRNAPHKPIWRAEIVLLSADGVGTNEIMRRTGKSKTCVWRWQERFMQGGLLNAAQGSQMGVDRGAPNCVHDRKNFKACPQGVQRRKRQAGLGP